MRRFGLVIAGLAGFALAVVPALAEDASVTTSGSSFSPNQVTVQPGDKVTIHNGGMGFHDLNWVDGARGQPNEGATDWSAERTFTAAGEYVYFCEVHGSPTSGMRGKVLVTTQPTDGTTTGTPTAPPPSADTTPPGVTKARATATRRAITVRLTLSEAATITLRLERGGRRIARRTYDVEDGAVVLRLRRALKQGRYSIRLTIVDEAGNRTTRSLGTRVT